MLLMPKPMPQPMPMPQQTPLLLVLVLGRPWVPAEFPLPLYPSLQPLGLEGVGACVCVSGLCGVVVLWGDCGFVAFCAWVLIRYLTLFVVNTQMDQIEGLRYRSADALRAVSKSAIRAARRKEIQREILNSEKLKAHFEDNPRDLEVLRHDVVLQHPLRIQSHLKHLPGYLLPRGLTGNPGDKRQKSGHRRTARHPKDGNRRRAKHDPLKSFSFSKKTKRPRQGD
eukprot:m.218552 g.218552  ORF g.218552 m.218552 type:complete len:225 (+) comp18684_c2_seq10:768-1442(+)